MIAHNLAHEQYSNAVPIQRRLLDELQPLIEAYRSAASKPKLDFRHKWENGLETLIPEYADVQNAVGLLIADADSNDRDRKPELAMSELYDAARLSNLIGNEPNLIAVFMSFACESSIENELELLQGRSIPSLASISRTRHVIDGFGSLPSVRRALSGEIVMMRQGLSLLGTRRARDVFGPNGAQLSLRLGGYSPVRNALDAKLIEYWRTVFRSFPKSGEDPIQETELLNKQSAWLDKQTDWQYAYVQARNQPYVGLGVALRDQLARRRVLSTLCDLLERDLQKPNADGALSQTADHTDPFTGEPLKVLRKPGGWIAYSLGRDHFDDHGRRLSGTHKDHVPNIVFEYPAFTPPHNRREPSRKTPTPIW